MKYITDWQDYPDTKNIALIESTDLVLYRGQFDQLRTEIKDMLYAAKHYDTELAKHTEILEKMQHKLLTLYRARQNT